MFCGQFACSTAHQSVGKFETAIDLSQYWSETEYPSYICGVFVWSQSADKMVLAFGVTDDEVGEAGRAEILTLISDTSTVTFVTQKYTYAQMCLAKEDLSSYLTSHYELFGNWGAGIRQSENYVYVDLWKNEGNSDEIEHLIDKAYEKYGDMVCFNVYETGGGLTLD